VSEYEHINLSVEQHKSQCASELVAVPSRVFDWPGHALCRRKQQGVYAAYTYGPVGKKVKVSVLSISGFLLFLSPHIARKQLTYPLVPF